MFIFLNYYKKGLISEAEFKSLLPPESLQIEQFFASQVGAQKIDCKYRVLRWGFALPSNPFKPDYVPYLWPGIEL